MCFTVLESGDHCFNEEVTSALVMVGKNFCSSQVLHSHDFIESW